MNGNIIKILSILIAALSLIFTGCTTLNTFPKSAHPGETVALGVGSPDDLSKATINSVKFAYDSDPLNPIDITANVRSVFRLYADKTSKVYTDNIGTGTGQITRTSAHEPWFGVMVIDIPEEISTGVPLPPGPGFITIDTTADVGYPTIGNHIKDTTIALEILPETSPNDFVPDPLVYEFGTCCTQLGNLALLEAGPRAIVKSNLTDVTGITKGYAGIELKLNFAGKTNVPITDTNIVVVPDDMRLYTNSSRSVITSVNNEVLTVIMMSTLEQLRAYEMRFEVALKPTVSFTGGTPTIDSVKFYDINGYEVVDSTSYSAVIR